MLTVGDKAPAFALQDDQGKTRRSSELKGKPYVLFFYPKDNTPGCTTEACSFRDHRAAFDKAGIAVFGVSADSSASHAKFVAKYGLNLPLLADPEHKLLEAYGVWTEKSLYGRKFMGIVRSTFAVGADGRVSHAWPKVKPAGHAEEVLAALSGKPAKAEAKPTATRSRAASGSATKAPAKKTAGSASASKAVAKKSPSKKAPVKQPPARKAPAKKAPARKAPAKKAAVKSAPGKR
ncbi:thioredoxin-dependent thiol peroxidase [Pseudomarimonas salicorniae]|uniref:thioredoxin-dependent thiol peroxidase n=1 Tax=Pseudomarimonas salicorniae TaxID=2933270 RepID=UPI003CCE4654